MYTHIYKRISLERDMFSYIWTYIWTWNSFMNMCVLYVTYRPTWQLHVHMYEFHIHIYEFHVHLWICVYCISLERDMFSYIYEHTRTYTISCVLHAYFDLTRHTTHTPDHLMWIRQLQDYLKSLPQHRDLPQNMEWLTSSRLLQIIGLLCTRALEKRRSSAKETYLLRKRPIILRSLYT